MSSAMPRYSLIVLVFAIGVSVIALWARQTRLGRSMRGVSTVVLSNDSRQNARNIQLHLDVVGGARSSEVTPILEAGAERRFEFDTTELYVRGISFSTGDREWNVAGGVIVTTGEERFISLRDNGEVVTYYLSEGRERVALQQLDPVE